MVTPLVGPDGNPVIPPNDRDSYRRWAIQAASQPVAQPGHSQPITVSYGDPPLIDPMHRQGSCCG